MPSNDLASITEVAQILSVPKRSAARYVERDDFPAPADALAVGRIWRRADIEAWAATALPLRPGRRPGPQVATFMIDRSEGRRFISISREVTARVVEHLRGSEDMCARELAERIVEETQLHTGGHDIQVGIGEDEALLGAVRVVISDGFGLRRLRDLERELAARIDATS